MELNYIQLVFICLLILAGSVQYLRRLSFNLTQALTNSDEFSGGELSFFHLVIFSYLLSQMFCIATFISVIHMLHFHVHLNEVVSYKTQSIRNSDRTESQKMLLMKIFVS